MPLHGTPFHIIIVGLQGPNARRLHIVVLAAVKGPEQPAPATKSMV